MAWSMDDKKVQSYINKAMSDNASYTPIDNQLNMAWSQLYMKREKDDPDNNDRELAAAEHYMYARWQVCSGKTWEEIMRIRTLGYDAAKLIGYFPPTWFGRKVLGHSWSRPSTDSIKWGMRGCNDGVKDTKAITKEP